MWVLGNGAGCPAREDKSSCPLRWTAEGKKHGEILQSCREEAVWGGVTTVALKEMKALICWTWWPRPVIPATGMSEANGSQVQTNLYNLAKPWLSKKLVLFNCFRFIYFSVWLAGVVGNCEPPCGCREQNLSPLQER